MRRCIQKNNSDTELYQEYYEKLYSKNNIDMVPEYLEYYEKII